MNKKLLIFLTLFMSLVSQSFSQNTEQKDNRKVLYLLIDDSAKRSFFANQTAIFYNIPCKNSNGDKVKLELYGENIKNQTNIIPSNPTFSTCSEVLNLLTENGTKFFYKYRTFVFAYSKKNKTILIHEATVKNGYVIEE